MNPHRQRQPGAVLLACAAVLLLALAVAQGYVSWRAQYGFVFSVKGEPLPSALEALGLDAGAVIFALLGLAHARMGHPARIERTLNVACAAGSATMNLLSADLGSPRSVVVYVLPAALYIACSDRLIATAAHAAGVQETGLWRSFGTAALYGLRLLLAFPSTALGLRRWLLQATPLPAAAEPGGQAERAGAAIVQVSAPSWTDAETAAIEALTRSVAGGNPLTPNAIATKFRLTRAEATRVVAAVTSAGNGHPSR
jgi:hypothetical protein